MAEYTEAQVWSAVNGTNHPSLSENERTIDGYMPLVEELFPGINYFSMTGFAQVMKEYVQPVLSKMFPNLSRKPAKKVSWDKTVNVEAFLPCEGYEHLDNPAWKQRLETLLLK